MEMILLFKNNFKILLILTILILISTSSFAEDGLNIQRWIVNSSLLENGDLKISEDITFNFRDKFNGVFRNIVLEGTDGISEIQLYELVEGDEIPYTLNMDANKGDQKVFKSEVKNNTEEIMIFSPSKNENKTFRIKYTLNNVGIKHNDIGELYYKFLGDENDTPIDYFSAIVRLPSTDRTNTKIFGHGPSNGEIVFLEDDKVKLEVSDVPSNEFIEGRILFPREFLPSSSNIGNKTLQDIVDEELILNKKLEEKAQRQSKMKDLFSNISIVIAGIGTLIIAFIFNKFRRNPDIYRKVSSLTPENITPAELRLFNTSMNDSRSLMTTIFDLARKGHISINEEDNPEGKKKDFIIKNIQKPKGGLLSHEIYLLGWLFNTIGNGEELSTKDIETYRKKSYGKFYKEFGEWQSKIKSNLYDREYYDHSTKNSGVGLLLLSLISFIISIVAFVNSSFYGLFSMFIAVFSFTYGLYLLTRKSDYGYIQDQIWKDYKRDLERFGKTPENYDEIIPQDKDLIYGLALGLPMKSLNKLRDKMPQVRLSSHWMYWYFITTTKGGSSFEDSLNSSIYGTTSTTASGSFGGGGGFSGGGGGGAGGGGAGGF